MGALRVHGVLTGVRVEWTNSRAKYTSVSFHLNKILAAQPDIKEQFIRKENGKKCRSK